MVNIYSQSSVENLVHDLENSGYSSAPLSCTKIGLGSFVLLAPDDFHYNIVVEEIALTYDSAGYKVSKRRKISNELRNRMESAQKRIDGFVGYYDYELYQ